MKIILTKAVCFITFSLLLMLSCQSQKAEFSQEGANYFGDEISGDGVQALASVTPGLATQDTVEVVLKGMINEVCQAKGCWMTLQEANAEGEEVFIRFKDYAFFVPKDAGGKEAIVKGKLFTNITSVEELQHYAEDKGKSKEEITAITSPKEELRMMAEGVIIYN